MTSIANTERGDCHAQRPLTVWIPTIQSGSGTEIFVLRLSKALKAAGHRPVLDWFPQRYEFAPWLLRSVIAPPGADIVHSNSIHGFAFKRSGLPLLVTDHNYVDHPDFLAHKGLKQKLYHAMLVRRSTYRTMACADSVVSVSHHNANAIQQAHARVVDVVHNWVDTEEYFPRRCDTVASDRPFRLLHVGNPSRWKGSEYLVRVARSLPRGTELISIGGLRSSQSTQSIPGLRVIPSVAPECMPEVYTQVDAVLMLSRHEAFGYAAIEAMAMGLPVIGFACNGVAEICGPTDCAMLSAVDDIEGVIGNIAKLAVDREQCAMLGENGRRLTMERYRAESQIEEYVSLYRKHLSPRDSAKRDDAVR